MKASSHDTLDNVLACDLLLAIEDSTHEKQNKNTKENDYEHLENGNNTFVPDFYLTSDVDNEEGEIYDINNNHYVNDYSTHTHLNVDDSIIRFLMLQM